MAAALAAAQNAAAVMEQINSLGVGTPEYHEALWFLCSILARKHYAVADQLRIDNRRRERAAGTREARKR